MKKISGFDLAMIIAFAVVGLLGAGAWYYLSGQLDTTKQDVAAADADFETYSSREVYLPTQANMKTLQTNIDLMQSQLDPLVKTKLQAPGNKLPTVTKEDTVAWKHDLDAEVSRLNTAAKVHGVTVPDNFYYGFSRYLNQNPGDEQTVVLSKQLLGVEQLANIFINAPVKAILTFRRTYEEDPMGISRSGGGSKTDTDLLPGRALVAPGNVYTAYPFEIELNATTENLRKIFSDLEKSPYVFLVRTIAIQNSNPNSPKVDDLEKMAGTPTGGVTDSSPGAVGAAAATKGPQFLFGNESLHVKMRVEMIEWIGLATAEAAPTPGNRARNRGSSPGGGQ
jgi:hypothetical protein